MQQKMKLEELQCHDLAKMFPEMPQSELDDLAADVAANGLIEPIVLFEEKILDGRHRYKACGISGVEPEFVELDDDVDPVAFVVSKNIRRRNLTPTQLACLGPEIKKAEAERAKERQRAGREKGGNTAGRGRPKDSKVEKVPPSYPDEGKSRDSAAKLLGVNAKYIDEAEKLQKETPDLFDKCVNGEINIPTAKKLAELPEGEREELHAKVNAGETTYKEAAKSISEAKTNNDPYFGVKPKPLPVSEPEQRDEPDGESDLGEPDDPDDWLKASEGMPDPFAEIVEAKETVYNIGKRYMELFPGDDLTLLCNGIRDTLERLEAEATQYV